VKFISINDALAVSAKPIMASPTNAPIVDEIIFFTPSLHSHWGKWYGAIRISHRQ
jgi:hypothetical protein